MRCTIPITVEVTGMTYTLWRCIGFSIVIVVLHIVVETIYIMEWRTCDGTPALSNKRSRYYLNDFISTAQAVIGVAQEVVSNSLSTVLSAPVPHIVRYILFLRGKLYTLQGLRSDHVYMLPFPL